MYRCTVTYGSIAAKWLTTPTLFQSLLLSHQTVELRPRRKFNSQSRWKCDARLQKSQPEYFGAVYGKHGDYTKATPLFKCRITVLPAGCSTIIRRWISETPDSNPRPQLRTQSKSSGASSSLQSPDTNTYNPDIPETQHLESSFKRRSLPVSPFMDPAFLQAKKKYRIRKPEPSKTPTEFQRQLAKNPYALALATPVRRCLLTKVKLPKYFLQDFMVMLEPKTQKPWYVPASLSNKHMQPKFQEGKDIDEAGRYMGPENFQNKIGFTVYTVNSKAALKALQQQKLGSKRDFQGFRAHTELSFIPSKMRESKTAMKAYLPTKWRPDMHDFVSDLMGRRIVSAFSHLWKLQRGYLVGCNDWDDALEKPQVAAFLWMGKVADEEMRGPPDFATLDVGTQNYNELGSDLGKRRRKVPVFNLKTLLGVEKISILRAMVPNGEVVALKHKNATAELQLKLWKLQGYTANHGVTE
ncbi:hypothetical protein PZA11_002115 [Diplocarpon coronariae]